MNETQVETRFRCEPIRSPAHRKFVRSLGCGIRGCRHGVIHAHHDRSAANSGTGVKPGDQHCVNLDGEVHHPELHRIGRRAFEQKYGVDLTAHALFLAQRSPDPRIRKAVAAR